MSAPTKLPQQSKNVHRGDRETVVPRPCAGDRRELVRHFVKKGLDKHSEIIKELAKV